MLGGTATQTREFKILSQLPGTKICTDDFCVVLQFENLGFQHVYDVSGLNLRFARGSLENAVQERLYKINSEYTFVAKQALNYCVLANTADTSKPDAASAHKNSALECPLCVGDFSDEPVVCMPCKCQYWVCATCLDRLMQEQDCKCPHCRSPYDSANFRNMLQRDMLASQQGPGCGCDAVCTTPRSNMFDQLMNAEIGWQDEFHIDCGGRMYATSCETFLQWEGIVKSYEAIYENFCRIWKLVKNVQVHDKFFEQELFKNTTNVCFMQFEKYWVELADMRQAHPQLPGFRAMMFFWDKVQHKLRDCLYQVETRGRKRERDVLRRLNSEPHAATVVGFDKRQSKRRRAEALAVGAGAGSERGRRI